MTCYAFSGWYVSEGTLQRDVAGCDGEGWKPRFSLLAFTSFMFTTFCCHVFCLQHLKHNLRDKFSGHAYTNMFRDKIVNKFVECHMLLPNLHSIGS